MRVVAIEKLKRPRQARILFPDGSQLTLDSRVLAESGLSTDHEVSPEALAELCRGHERRRAMDSALRLIAYRPRSEADIRARLARKQLDQSVIDETVQRLRELGLIDDEAFARSWVESRMRSSPRGKGLICWELRSQGVDPELAQEATSEIDDEEAAYSAALRKAAKSGSYSDYRKLRDFLLRRGFGYQTVARALRRVEEEAPGQ
ncbi:MAG TPA: RecX family transcriptional regulator [Dehalococcoidia bacterium]|nr:RecX family transcriptional regulator [Dehalococcoidia bacterium]